MPCESALGSRSLSSRCGRGWFLPETPRDSVCQSSPSPASGCCWQALGLQGLWLHPSDLCPSSHALSLPMSKFLSPYEDTRHSIRIHPNPGRPRLKLNASAKTDFQIRSPSEVFGSGLPRSLFGGHNPRHNTIPHLWFPPLRLQNTFSFRSHDSPRAMTETHS